MAAATPARRAFLQLMTAVAVVHLSAIALYYGLDIPEATAMRQRAFAWTWIMLTAMVVLVGLQRLKRARRLR
jgi:hypothetical protein